MASGARVRLSGRFRPGTDVEVVKVQDERALRAEGGEVLGRATVDKDGVLEFSKGVEESGYYILVGQIDGQHVEVRIRGRKDDGTSILSQPPVQPDRVRLADGSWADERPEKREVPGAHVGPSIAQDQVPEGTPQRIDTGRGQGFPVDPDEQVPMPRQEDEDGPQMVEADTGAAYPAKPGIARQEDAQDIPQRVVADTGQAFPIPEGDAVDATRMKESSDAKVMRGGPQGAASSPLGIDGPEHKDPEDTPDGLRTAPATGDPVDPATGEAPEPEERPKRRRTVRSSTRRKS